MEADAEGGLVKIVICTLPLRSSPTFYPPLGSMALIKSLRPAGYDPYFYDIDALRPTFEEAVRFFEDQAPDVVGISAMVSTGYAYTKRLALAIRQVSPKTKIIVGGNLAASSEILLKLAKVDVCGIGEGEHTIVNLVRYYEEHKAKDDYAKLGEINSIAFLDEDGEMAFTGFDTAIPATEFLDPDYSILEQFSKIEHYLPAQSSGMVRLPLGSEDQRASPAGKEMGDRRLGQGLRRQVHVLSSVG